MEAPRFCVENDARYFFNQTDSTLNIDVVMAIAEGRERQEIGFSILDTTASRVIYLNEVTDNIWFSETTKKIVLFDVKVVVFPDMLLNSMSVPKLLEMIREKFPWVSLIKQNFRFFNHKTGEEVACHLCAPEYLSGLKKDVGSKKVALASLAGLYEFTSKAELLIAPHTARIEFLANIGKLSIDVDTANRLELVQPAGPGTDRKSKFSLLSLLDTCVTKTGKSSLRAQILEPHRELEAILERQSCIQEMMNTDRLMTNCRMALEKFKEVHKLLKLQYSITITDNVKAAEGMLNLMMLLKLHLEAIPDLRNALSSPKTQFLKFIAEGVSNPAYEAFLNKICEVLEPEIHVQKNRSYFQRLFMIRGGVNKFLDVLRDNLSKNIEAIRTHVEAVAFQVNLPLKMVHTSTKGFHIRLHLDRNTRIPREFPPELQITSRTDKAVCFVTARLFELNDNVSKIGNQMQIMNNMIICQLFQEVRNEIHLVYSLVDFVTELDVVLALSEYSKSHAECRPEFGEEMEVVKGMNPLLELSWKVDKIVPNNIMANPDYNFFVITGNNMCGKTTYIKMVALLQILAHLGCNLPAKSAKMRLCDKILSRMGFDDNIDQNLSSFAVEMQDMEFILTTMTSRSLVVIDELCRSTNVKDAEVLSYVLCEKLLKFLEVGSPLVRRPFVFLVTHFEHLERLSDRFMNVVNLHLDEEKEVVYAETQTRERTQLKLAKGVSFPTCVIKRAEEILNDPRAFSSLSFSPDESSCFNATDFLKDAGLCGGARELYDVAATFFKAFRKQDPSSTQNLEELKNELGERLRAFMELNETTLS